MTALSFLKEQQQARQDMIFMLRQTFALKKENRLLFRQVFAQKLTRAGFFQFIHAQVLGFKHRCQLDNTVGIIDSDYYNSSNEGHIMIKISCDAHDDGHKAEVAAGDGFAQGIFYSVRYYC